jgi:beta-lactam-binding protein with PASTA domain
MNTRLAAATAVLVLAAAATACGPDDTSSGSTTSSAVTGKNSTGSSKTETKTIPNLIGKGLQSAQDEAQAAGFYNLDSHDSLGRGRNQILDRDWKVCTQTPAAGKTAPTDTKLDFGTVKLDETCPSKDQAEPSVAGGKMPNLAGKSVKAARAALDSSTSITVTDATGDSRMILVESNWQVCSQDPAPGKALNGQPVEFTAVKFGEGCP